MKKLIECVPNFSEGRDLAIINEITTQIQSVDGVMLLDVDPGASTHRTVVTFVGEPAPVIEAAFLAIKKASELIDMRNHKGAHPRMGATDVCPLIPISNISDEETVEWANKLAERVGKELEIPVYMYEKAASEPKRKNLATVRAGEYEGFAKKIYDPEWKPDFGPVQYNEKSGQTAISVRDFLIAYNINLNTKSVRKANAVAFDVREKGRIKVINGKKVRDAEGNVMKVPGSCKSVKGIGWYVDEYGIAQVSMNLTDINVTPLHKAFDECNNSAHRRGMRVTGSELIGLLPKKCLIDAGKYFLEKQGRSKGVSEEEIIQIAVKSMGLDDLKPFDPKEKIIEYRIADTGTDLLVDLNQKEFNNLLASDAPAPGGGSVAALCGALGASLGTMVANLSANKRGWDKKIPFFSDWAEQGQALKDELLWLVDEDTRSFNKVMDAMRLPKGSEEEIKIRVKSIDDANKYAAEIPYKVMQAAFSAYPLIHEMAEKGNPNSITDAGVGAMCIHTAVRGAALNTRINLTGVEDTDFVKKMIKNVNELIDASQQKEVKIMSLVESKM